MDPEREQLAAAIAALEAQRAFLGDAVVDSSLRVLRTKLDELDGVDLPAQKLKQVTILFLDVAGSTTLSLQLDPEEIHSVLDGALARCSEVVEAQNGKVLQYAGDNLLAVFGADESREDDAERAVRCGLALLAEGRELGEMVQRRYGHAGLNVRVGIHTGTVLLGGGVDAAASIRGIAVNVAARMEQTAPAGGLRISHDTYRQVRGVFDVEVQPPLHVKGVDESIETYLVQRAKPRAFRVPNRGIEGLETPMVGRGEELALLQQGFLALFQTPGLRAFTVEAEAGLGKSRLLHEFENWAETRPEPFHVFRARAQIQTLNQPFGLLRDLLAWRFEIADSDTMPAARQKFENGIVPLFADDDDPDIARGHAHLLGHLIGLDFHDSPHVQAIVADGAQTRRRGLHAAAQMFRRIAARGRAPVVLLLEDLHWADNASLDFLDELAKLNRDVPMLLLGSTRPALFEQRPDWGRGAHQRIRLGPLGDPARRALADVLLHRLGEVPAELNDLVVGATDGNPFYMEEVVRMLIDERAIRTDSVPWQLDADKLRRTHVPPTLTGVLQARLDRLAARERLTLQQAAVIGFVFWDRALAAIDAAASGSLTVLLQRGLVVARPDSAFEEAREYSFGHHLLHQVVYETLLKRTRRDMHARTAAWMAGLTGARVYDALGVIAEHYDRADDRANAREYYARAAENAAARFAHDPLMRYVARALELADADANDAALRWRLLVARERALGAQGLRAEQAADIAALQGLAQTLGDRERIAQAAWRRCDWLERTGDYANALPAAREAMRLAELAESPDLLLSAQTRAAMALYRLGETSAGIALAQDGLEAARRRGLRDIEGLFLNALSALASLRVDPVACLNYDEAHLRICRELGDTLQAAYAQINVGNDLIGLGEHDRARDCLTEGLRLTRALGNRMGQANALFNLSILALRQGDASLAQTHARAALDISVATRYPEAEFWSWLCLGNADLALGRLVEAAANFERARSMSRAAGNHWLLDTVTGLARVALAQGELHVALEWLAEPLAQVAGKGELDGAESPCLVLLTCHRALRCTGDARADDLLKLAHACMVAKAETITDPALRGSYLSRIPEHREIALAWAARQAESAGR